MTAARVALIALLALIAGVGASRADPPALGHVKVCVVRSMGGAPSFVAKDKGFFADAGLDAEVLTFDSAQPIALAVASGDCDFGATAMSAAFFNLAGQGILKIIGAGTWEHAGFQSIGVLVSNQAYAAGLYSFKDMAGHSVAITQLGTPLQYYVLMIGQKFGIDPTSLKFLALQSNSVVASALAGGQTDMAVQTAAPISVILQKGDGRVLGWTTDVLPARQGEAVFTATKSADERPAVVKAYLQGLRAGEKYFHDAFVGADGQRRDGPSATEAIAIAAKYLHQPDSTIRLGIPYFDPQSRISMNDIEAPMNWYKSQHMLKPEIDAKKIVDMRYAIEMPK